MIVGTTKCESNHSRFIRERRGIFFEGYGFREARIRGGMGTRAGVRDFQIDRHVGGTYCMSQSPSARRIQ